MQTEKNVNIERIIAKLDNDFNLDNTDWVPRIAAWTIDAMNILKVTPKEKKRIKVNVVDKIAYSPCVIDFESAKVYDSRNCEIPNYDECGCVPSTGGESVDLSNTMMEVDTGNTDTDHGSIAIQDNDYDSPRHFTVGSSVVGGIKRYYVAIDNTKLELSFNTPFIYIEFNSTKTYKSDTFGCELPLIPNNGKLIECIVYYCMYKILCRGYKHPVMNLQASQYGTNPYYLWMSNKEAAKRSVLAGEEFDDKHAWDSAMVDFMFK